MLKKILRFFAGESFTVILLLLLIVVTVIGTLAQTSMGLFQAKKMYFDSFFGTTNLTWFGHSVNVYLPGGYLLCLLLFVNLILALFLRIRWQWKNAGAILCHLGVLVFFAGCYFTFHYAREGYLSLQEGQSSQEFVSYHVHELLLRDTTQVNYDNVLAFPEKMLRRQINWKRENQPFAIAFAAFYENCGSFAGAPANPGIFKQDFVLQLRKLNSEDEQNHAGCLVRLSAGDKIIGEASVLVDTPLSFSWNNRSYMLLLRKERMELPFALRLLQFIHETYPGTDTAKRYESRVELNEGNNLREVAISMNRPLRYKGYTFYQSSFAGDRPGSYRSILAVVNNPTAVGPYLSCLMVLLGMIVHFVYKLLRFLRQRAERKE